MVAVAVSQIMATEEDKPVEASDAEHMDVAEDAIDQDVGAIFVRVVLREGITIFCERVCRKNDFS